MKFDAGFWTLEILIIIYFSVKYLKMKIGNHQKITIFILAFILFSVQIVNSLLPKTDHHCNDEQCLDKYMNDNNMYIFIIKKFGHFGWIIFISFLYLFDFIMRDYSWVKLKFLMDKKSIPLFKIINLMGIIGCSLIIICLIILSKIPCNIIENIEMNNDKYIYVNTDEDKEVDFNRQVCGLIDYDNITKKLKFYYDNFNIFFKDYSNSNRELLEIFVIPIYLIINILINLSYMIILKHLDPNAMLVNVNFNYFLSRMITYIKNGANEKYLTLIEFILLELCEIIAIIAYMIYIELIELKFCRLDYDLKRIIEQRSKLDSSLYSLGIDEDSVENDYDIPKEDEEIYY